MNKKHIVLFVLLALTAFSAFGQDAAGDRSAASAGVSSAQRSSSASPPRPAPSASRKAIAAAVEGIARNPERGRPDPSGDDHRSRADRVARHLRARHRVRHPEQVRPRSHAVPRARRRQAPGLFAFGQRLC